MKKIFILILVFLFLSCSNGGKRTVDNDSSAENTDTGDIENIDADDIEFSDENDTETVDDTERCYTWSDEDPENTDDEYPENDDNEDEPVQGICLEEPCKDVENSTGKCLARGENGDYACVCKENFVWFPNKKTCEPLSSFKGLSCTGQTKCYDNEKEIPCPKAGEPFFGQDANYAENRSCLPQNFTIKHYESGTTVIDNNSKLEWTQQVTATKNPYTRIVGGYYNWRVPTFQDYNSIIDSGTFAPAINEAYFPNTPSDIFVTGIHEYLNHTGPQEGYYYYVIEGMNFKTGLSEYNTYEHGIGMPETLYFRTVRDLPEKPESCGVTLQSDEYKLINLLPQKLLLIRTPDEGKNWQEALEYCENLNYAGISDWRLPNRNEAYLATLKLKNQYESLICWSSTTYTGNPTQALFYYGDEGISTAGKITGKANASCCVAFDPCPGSEIWTGEKCVSTEEIVVKEGECGCSDGYTLENSQCVKICDDDLCKDKAHSTGHCLNVQEKDGIENVSCQCEENYFLNENFECVNPCDAAPCQEKENSDGTCVPTGASSFTCGCKKGYYPKSNKCIAVNSNDCFIDYTDNACVNNIAGLMWSSTSSSFPPSTSTSFQLLRWSEAKKYCENHEEAGYTDWRLPKVEELWTFAKSCNNIPKESCEASEKNCCLSEECISQCKCRIPENTYNYPSYDTFWSSSFKSDDPDKVIVLYSFYYNILEFRDIKKDYGLVKCVRNIE